MTGTELRVLRRHLRLSQRKIAPLLGIHWNTQARYERGELPIPAPIVLLAKMLAAQRLPDVRHEARGLPKGPSRARTLDRGRRKVRNQARQAPRRRPL